MHWAKMMHGLKKDAISFVSNVVIGVASTAPAYSLAAALPGLVARRNSACRRS